MHYHMHCLLMHKRLDVIITRKYFPLFFLNSYSCLIIRMNIENGYQPIEGSESSRATFLMKSGLSLIFVATAIFYFVCVTTTFGPVGIMATNNHSRLLEEESCHVGGAVAGFIIGAGLGSAVIFTTFVLLGLTPLGPISGGLFAANMGAAIPSGSAMALFQSAAMTGTAYGTGAALGAAAGATMQCMH